MPQPRIAQTSPPSLNRRGERSSSSPARLASGADPDVPVHWWRAEATFELGLTVPGNRAGHLAEKFGMTRVQVTDGDRQVWDSGRQTRTLPGIDSVAEGADAITLWAGSGSYRFRLTGHSGGRR